MAHKKSYYVFWYKRGHKTPNRYEGPYPSEVKARSIVRSDAKKYGDGARVVIRHLTAEGFGKVWH